MDLIQNIIEKIKEKQSFKNDKQLIDDINKTVKTTLGPTSISDWKRNDSLKKELLEYCLLQGISLDEILRPGNAGPQGLCTTCPLKRNVQILDDDDDKITVQIGLETTITARKKHQLQED